MAAGPKGFWPRDFPRDSIHNDTRKAFPHTFILSSSRTSKEGFLSANGVPRDTIGKRVEHEALTMVRVIFRYASLGCRKNVSVLGREEGYTPPPEGVPEGEAGGNS